MSSKLRSKLRDVVFGHMTPESAKVSRNNLKSLAAYLRVPAGEWAVEDALALLMGMSEADLNAKAEGWKKEQSSLKPTAAKRRVAALKSAWSRISEEDLIRKRLKIKNPHVEASRQEFPPEDVRRYFEQAEREADKKRENGKRNYSIIMMLYERLIGREEVVKLEWPADVDLKRSAIRIGDEWLAISPICLSALVAWLDERGTDWTGPLYSPRALREPLQLETVNHTVMVIGIRSGLKYRISPTLLWQAAIDRVLELGWDLLKVQQFCRVSAMTIKRHIARMPKRRNRAGSDNVGMPEIADLILGACFKDSPMILGDRMEWHYTEAEYNILTTMIKYSDPGLTGPELNDKSGHPSADAAVRKLLNHRVKGPPTRQVVETPRKKGCKLFRVPSGFIPQR